MGNKILNSPMNAKVYSAKLDTSVSPRAAAMVSKDISSQVLPTFCDRDTVAVSCNLTGQNGQSRTVWWVSAYMPGDSIEEPPPITVQRITHHCRINNIPLIICCDANAHHEVWNSTNEINNPSFSIYLILVVTRLVSIDFEELILFRELFWSKKVTTELQVLTLAKKPRGCQS